MSSVGKIKCLNCADMSPLTNSSTTIHVIRTKHTLSFTNSDTFSNLKPLGADEWLLSSLTSVATRDVSTAMRCELGVSEGSDSAALFCG